MPDLVLKGMTIKAGVSTKSMDRKQFDREPRQIKVIPRSNDVAVIVPLPSNPVNSEGGERRSIEDIKKSSKRQIDAGILRFDI